MDDIRMALAEAMFRAQYSDSNGDEIDRAWTRMAPRSGYVASRVVSLLKDAGYEIRRADGN